MRSLSTLPVCVREHGAGGRSAPWIALGEKQHELRLLDTMVMQRPSRGVTLEADRAHFGQALAKNLRPRRRRQIPDGLLLAALRDRDEEAEEHDRKHGENRNQARPPTMWRRRSNTGLSRERAQNTVGAFGCRRREHLPLPLAM